MHINFNQFKKTKNSQGHLVVTGYATTNRLDSDNEQINLLPIFFKEAEEAFFAKQAPVLVEHGFDELFGDTVVGKVLSFKYPEKYNTDSHFGIEAVVLITNPKAIELVEKGKLNSFSLGWEPGEVFISETDKTKHIHTGIVINEVTICSDPANDDCRFIIVDSEDDSILEFFGLKEGQEVEYQKNKAFIKSLYLDDNNKPHYTLQFQDRFLKSNTPIPEDKLIVNIKTQSFNDYPKKAIENAKKALKWREKHPEEVKFGTRTGWIRANQLANRENLSLDVIKRMAQFKRHRRNSKIKPGLEKTPWKDRGYGAWLLWGGNEGVNWAIRKLESLEKQKEKTKKTIKPTIYSKKIKKYFMNEELKNKLTTKVTELTKMMGLDTEPTDIEFSEKTNMEGDTKLCVYFTLLTEIGDRHVVEVSPEDIDELSPEDIYTILDEDVDKASNSDNATENSKEMKISENDILKVYDEKLNKFKTEIMDKLDALSKSRVDVELVDKSKESYSKSQKKFKNIIKLS